MVIIVIIAAITDDIISVIFVIFVIMRTVIIVFTVIRLRAAVWLFLGTQPSKDCTAVALKRPRYFIIIIIFLKRDSG